jgi:hypothetical protein
MQWPKLPSPPPGWLLPPHMPVELRPGQSAGTGRPRNVSDMETRESPPVAFLAAAEGTERAFGRIFPGQCSVVSLPACQQRALDGIESALQAREPRLASMFAIFTRLARDEAVPRTESLRAGTRFPWSWLGGLTTTPRAFVAISLVLSFMALLVLLVMNRPAAHACGPAAGLRAVAVAQARSCQAAPESPGR